jgi:hypothetical protein
MLVQGPLPMSDPPALMFLALALAAGAALWEEGGRGSALALGGFASAAIGCRPQLALVVLPSLAVALVQAPGWRRRGEAVAAFTLVSLLWFVPLVVATGGLHGLLDYQMKQAAYVAGHDATASRAGGASRHLVRRFVTHPWGQKGTAFPVLALALAGIVDLVRRRRAAALPLALLAGGQLAVCLLIMDPADAVRYALPSLLGVAFAAALGGQLLARLAKAPPAAWIVPLVVATVGLLYAGPLLWVRCRTVSPPISALRWARRNLPPQSVILMADDMAPHIDYLMQGFDLAWVEQDFHHVSQRPGAPAWLVAEGESHWPGAVTFRWPDSDAYHKLTRDHYRVVSLSPIPLDHRFQSVRGVRRWQPSLLDARYRWLEADAAIRIFPRRAFRAVVVRLGLDLSSPIPANSVTVSMAGAPDQTVEIARGTIRNVQLPLATHQPTDIGIRSARSFPAGNGEPRPLAVQLLAVERIH